MLFHLFPQKVLKNLLLSSDSKFLYKSRPHKSIISTMYKHVHQATLSFFLFFITELV